MAREPMVPEWKRSDIRVDWRHQRPAWSWFNWVVRVTLATAARAAEAERKPGDRHA